MTSDERNSKTATPLLPQFGEGFLEDHARLMINDPKIALVELVANSWDAGADRVEISWPKQEQPDSIVIRDNGVGMTFDEFTRRWLYLNYERLKEQGSIVIFPSQNKRSKRTAYGRNGKGRLSVFCFANEYEVETIKDGEYSKFRVRKASSVMNTPYLIDIISRKQGIDGHGTTIKTELGRNYVPVDMVRDLLGSKFVADPAFHIYLNGDQVVLTDIEHLSDTRTLTIEGIGKVIVRCFDSRDAGRTSKQHGVAWWVNKRLVGEPSWRDFDAIAYIDARTAEAKRYTFVVEADVLVDEVAADWSQFNDTSLTQVVRQAVNKHILDRLQELMRDVHRSKKVAVLVENKALLRNLSLDSQNRVGEFVDEIQRARPTIEPRELSATVQVLSNLEKTRSGYGLIEQLAKLKPHDLDTLHDLLDNWSVAEARVVLSELGWRLKLIERLERLVENPTADELHDIHPLFEKGLWIFGPEYESPAFASNQSLVKVVGDFLHSKQKQPLTYPRRRPDIIALPSSTLSIYSTDSYDDRAEVDGYGKVLILELKKGGFRITRDERSQIETYAIELQKSGKIQGSTALVGFVLGATLDEYSRGTFKINENIHIFPRTYNTILRQAHARTFDLLKKIQASREEMLSDPEVAYVLSQPEQETLFDNNGSGSS